MLVVVILILSILLSVTFVVIGKSYKRIEDLNKEVIKLKSDVKKVEEVIQIEPGDKALLPDYYLTSKTDNVNFCVDFEVEILEVSIDQVKVKAVDYTSLDTYPNDSKNKQSIINFLQNHWVPKKDIQLIVDDQMRREKKLKQLGI